MHSTIRKIGNSKGIIIPQTFLKRCSIDSEINIEVDDEKIVITSASPNKRIGWANAFQKMSENGDDDLVIPDVLGDDTITDWTWK